MTTQGETYQRLTVSEAAAVLGVSRMTVRRMIERGQLEAERVHRPQGSAYVVKLPADGTAQGTPTAQVPRHTGRTNGTGQGTPSEQMAALLQATLTPIIAPLVAEIAAARQAGERKDDVIRAQADQLVAQAETIGRQAAELEALRARPSTLDAPGSTPASHPSSWPSLPQARAWAVYGAMLLVLVAGLGLVLMLAPGVWR